MTPAQHIMKFDYISAVEVLDYNMIQLIPTYQPYYRREKSTSIVQFGQSVDGSVSLVVNVFIFVQRPFLFPPLRVLKNVCYLQVTHLVIKRPQFFHFKPGDYVYINIPDIAKYEWHPFTISSAPEQPGFYFYFTF